MADGTPEAPLEFGWFLPSAGDATSLGDPAAQVAPSPEMMERVVAAAEAAGFEYMLVPVQTACWEAWITRRDGRPLHVDQHAGRGASGLHQAVPARQDDHDVRSAVGRTHLRQPDRRAERGRNPGRGHHVARRTATRSWRRRSGS